MRKTVFKFFFIWAWEEEERWINEMASKGWHLVQVGFCRYVFEKGEPGAYQYRLEALNSWAKTEESREYIAFAEEAGEELVGSLMYWAYFRRKAEEGPYESFSDTASKLKHIQRFGHIPTVFIPVLALNVLNCIRLIDSGLQIFGGLLLTLNNALLVILCFAAYRIRHKIQKLQNESNIRE